MQPSPQLPSANKTLNLFLISVLKSANGHTTIQLQEHAFPSGSFETDSITTGLPIFSKGYSLELEYELIQKSFHYVGTCLATPAVVNQLRFHFMSNEYTLTSLPATELITFIRDASTPSGSRLKPQDGSLDWRLRYQLYGGSSTIHHARSILDLIVQTTPEVNGLNGRTFVMDKFCRLQEILLGLSFGKSKWKSPHACVEDFLKIHLRFD